MRYGESNMAFIDKKKVLKTFNEYVNKYDASNVMIALKIKHTLGPL